MNTEKPEFMTTEEVAAFFRTSSETVRYWRNVGKGPASFKIGRRVLYERAAVENHLNQARSGSGENPPDQATVACPRCGGALSISKASVPGRGAVLVPIEEFNLMVRPYNALKRAGINVAGELILKTADDLIGLGVREQDLPDIQVTLAKLGLALAGGDR